MQYAKSHWGFIIGNQHKGPPLVTSTSDLRYRVRGDEIGSEEGLNEWRRVPSIGGWFYRSEEGFMKSEGVKQGKKRVLNALEGVQSHGRGFS